MSKSKEKNLENIAKKLENAEIFIYFPKKVKKLNKVLIFKKNIVIIYLRVVVKEDIIMKKSRKLMLRLVPVFLVLTLICVSTSSIFAISVTKPSGSANANISKLAGNIWGTVAVIVQILAIAAIVLAGVRYMFASADEKADIKKQTVILVVGAILVFAAVPIAGFIANTANQVF